MPFPRRSFLRRLAALAATGLPRYRRTPADRIPLGPSEAETKAALRDYLTTCRPGYGPPGFGVPLDTKGLPLIGDALYYATRDIACDALCGLPGPDSIGEVVACLCAYHARGEDRSASVLMLDDSWRFMQLPLLEHGAPGRLAVIAASRPLSSVGLTLAAIDTARSFGYEVVAAVSLVENVPGAREIYRAHGIGDYRAVFTEAELRKVPPPVEGRAG